MLPKRLKWQYNPAIISRQAIQWIAFIAFGILFVWTRRNDGLPFDIVNIWFRLDPLVTLAEAIAGRVLLTGSALALITVALTLVFGRAWCGWLCPLGTTLDLFEPKRGLKIKVPENWRNIKHILLIAIVVAALFGNLTLLIFDPITIIFRAFTVGLYPALDESIRQLETLTYQNFTDAGEWVMTVDSFLRPNWLPIRSLIYRDGWVYVTMLVVIIALNWIAPRFWCRYLCPLGSMLGLMSKVALVKRRVTQECPGCLACTRACPTGIIKPENTYDSDPSECTMCMNCTAICPQLGNKFVFAPAPAKWNTYDPQRRQTLAIFGAATLGVFLLKKNPFAQLIHKYFIQPPGGRENNLLAKCIRCGECVRVCPTNAIQPSVTEAGAEGLWTPILVTRLGQCDYGCNSCGQVCPVQAIPPLSLEEKRKAVIGIAVIDKDTCLAWGKNTPCIVCEEMCPLSPKAITLDEVYVRKDRGETLLIQRPVVHNDKCIGCGICELKCPVEGVSAIRVQAIETVEM